MDVEGGRLCCSARELSELYRELQLLRIKYDQLVDVFRKLTKSWRVKEAYFRVLLRSFHHSSSDCVTGQIVGETASC